MKKKSLEQHHHSIGIVILVVVAVMMVLVALSYFNPNMLFSNQNIFFEKPNHTKNEAYNSDHLNISFLGPEGFAVEENYTNIALRKNNGQITISRIGTNYEDIDKYVNSLIEKNNLSIKNKEFLEMNGNSTIAVETSDRRIFFLNPEMHLIYTIETNSPDLYDELDQVAQSFRYTP